ncbi:MAG: hypothetical protein LN573_02575 [Rickettsia endosymbiont of Oxypoda opaca]|nr:hypothetical protein [Rickettsia endosymbiont of Oxypoda opaca]
MLLRNAFLASSFESSLHGSLNIIARGYVITVESEKVVIKLLQFFTTRERNNHNIAILLVVIFTSHKEYFMILFLTFNSYGGYVV